MASDDNKFNLHELYRKNAADVAEAFGRLHQNKRAAELEAQTQKAIIHFFTRSAEDIFIRKIWHGRIVEETGKIVAMTSFPLLVIFPDLALFGVFALSALAIAGGEKYAISAFVKRNALVMPTLIGSSPSDCGNKKVFIEAQGRIDAWKDNPSALCLG